MCLSTILNVVRDDSETKLLDIIIQFERDDILVSISILKCAFETDL